MPLVRTFFATIRRANPLLHRVAWAHVALAVLFLVLMPFDTRLVTGINPWIKPFKFASSIALYVFTLAYCMSLLPDRRLVRRVSIGVTAAMAIEIVLISLQAARGVRSHFNEATPFDFAVFGVMGAAILGNAVLDAWVGWAFWQPQPRIPAAPLWGIRLGLVLFVLGSLEGFLMAGRLAHSVGVPDGGPGLPVLNWSTVGGDLRLPHFLALHSLQVLPLVGFVLYRRDGPLKARAVALTGLAAAAYAVLIAAALGLALSGTPLVRG